MTTTAHILTPFMARFAKELLANGFQVYLPDSDVKRVAKGGKPAVGKWFTFSRVVNGQTCYAHVSEDFFETVKFSMPIKPSRECGSSMWIGGSIERHGTTSEIACVENADLYASPTGHNPLVGTHPNYWNPTFPDSYVPVFE